MKNRCLLVLSLVAVSAPASAMDLEIQQRASGLALIMAATEPCQFQLDQAALDRYFTTNKFDQPETLSFISNSVVVKKVTGKFDPATCTIARRTAESTGLLAK